MYTHRIQIINYGPIDHLDIEFAFDGENPKPIVLVGENGSGKSILLSHIVNGLAVAKGRVYPDTPEVETGKSLKIRTTSYIKHSNQWCFAKVDFESNFYIGELTILKEKRSYDNQTIEFPSNEIVQEWQQMMPDDISRFISNISPSNDPELKDVLKTNYVLYFPPNRFEEPAWLNEENLKAQAKNMVIKHLVHHTTRKMINYSLYLGFVMGQ